MAARGGPATLNQLEQFASATHAPLGYFFLREPPEERVPMFTLAHEIAHVWLGHPSRWSASRAGLTAS